MRAKLGQHFMKNRAAIRKIVAGLELKANDLVIEIGGGKGALTLPVAAEAEKKGAAFTVIERDRELVPELQERLRKEFPTTEVIEGDAITLLPTLMSNAGDKEVKIVGNIPYYLTGKLLRVLSELEILPHTSLFTIQAEVADRIVAAPPEMNLLAAVVSAWAEPKILMRLKPTDFEPSPEVSSAIIILSRMDSSPSKEERERFFEAMRLIFRQPRKTVWNNLRAGGAFEEEKLKKTLKETNIDPGLRPQNLSRDMLIRLAAKLV